MRRQGAPLAKFLGLHFVEAGVGHDRLIHHVVCSTGRRTAQQQPAALALKVASTEGCKSAVAFFCKRKRPRVIHMGPLFMSATTGVPSEPSSGSMGWATYSPTHFRVQYNFSTCQPS